MPERLDRRGTHFVAASDGERQAVPFDARIGLEDDIRGRIVRIGVNGVAANLILRGWKSEIENREPGNLHRETLDLK